MKKALVLAFICFVCGQTGALELAQSQLMNEISTNHFKAFSNRAYMYEKQLDNGHIEKWSEAIAHTKDFVEANALRDKEKLLECVNKIENANDEMVNTIKAAYATIRGTGFDQQKRMKEVEAFSKKYQAVTNTMEDVKKKSNSIEKTNKTDSERKAAQMVYVLANFVGETASSAKTDLF